MTLPLPSAEGSAIAGTVFDLSSRVFLRVTGADRLRFLNGQLTQDLRKLGSGQALPSCVTNAKGRLQAVVWVWSEGESLVLDGDPGFGETLSERLERYIIADDVTLEEVTGQLGLLHFTEEEPEMRAGLSKRRACRLGVEGWDVSGSVEAVAAYKAQLGGRVASEEQWEICRVFNGIPKWGAELSEETLPPEAGLERSHIDYHKGCYIGQEVISRLKSVGHVNRNLFRFRADAGSPVPLAGGELLAENGDRVVGRVTSAVRCEGGEVAVLGYVKRGEEGGSFRSADGVFLRRIVGV